MAKNSCFSTKINLNLKTKLLEDLQEQGFEIAHPANTFFSAKKEGVSVTLYLSGSLTVQGKKMQEFIEFYLEPEILQTFSSESSATNINLQPRIGLDEAGKGDYFGPLCIAGVYASEEAIKELAVMGVQDSKNLSDAKVKALAEKIRNICSYTVIRLFPHKYNELYQKFKNLNRLLAWAHVAALGDLSKKTGCQKAILDQFADPGLVDQMLKQKNIDCVLEQRVRAEEDIVVAAASILARSGFLEGLAMLSEEIQHPLPKGASSIVIQTGKVLVEKFGCEILDKAAKTHFKTTQQITHHA